MESCPGAGRRAPRLVPFLPGNSDSPHALGVFSDTSTSTSPSAGRGEADGVLRGGGSGPVLPVLSRSPQQPLLFLSPPTPPWLPQVSAAPGSFQPFVYEAHTWLPGQLSPQTLEIAPLYSDLRRRKLESSVEGLPGSNASASSPPLHGDSPRMTRETHFCAVCSDLASGYHYGVWSCEGCKAFFKRSIQGKTNYVCPATNQCTIDKNRRKSCQACRLRRCHEVGMVRDACQRERRASCPTKKAEPPQIQKTVAHDHIQNAVASKSCQARDGCLNARPSGPAKFANATMEPLGSLSSEQFLTCLLNAEPPKMTCHHDVSRPFTAERLMMLLTNLADRELVHMIGWAKKVPGFVQISLRDQVLLLESSWLEVLIMGLIWRSMSQPGKLVFASNLILDRDDGECVEGIFEIFDILLNIVQHFRELQVWMDEYVCLKAIILLNASLMVATSEKEGSRAKVQQLVEATTDTLVKCIARRSLTTPEQFRRLSHLLTILSHIRHIRYYN
uniref:Estrogen receptor 2 n=1 Tax=Eptatretus burgeri TaxID=7764 RepID=A0A8C4N8L6_EPTBU